MRKRLGVLLLAAIITFSNEGIMSLAMSSPLKATVSDIKVQNVADDLGEETSGTSEDVSKNETEVSGEETSDTESTDISESMVSTDESGETEVTETTTVIEETTVMETASEEESFIESVENASVEEVNNFIYSIYNEQITIDGYNGQETEIEIPSEIEGYPVTSVGASAFSENDKVTKIILPSTITSIGYKCFYNAVNLKSITIPQNVQYVGADAFYNSIEEIIFAEGMIAIPSSVCKGATNLERVIMPETITSIGNYAFKDCTKLNTIELGKNVESIGMSCFYNATSLECVIIPKNVTKIYSQAFYNSAKELIFEEGMSCIPDNACSGANNLEKVVMAESVTIIGSNAFLDCTSLSDISLSMNVFFGMFDESGRIFYLKFRYKCCRCCKCTVSKKSKW